MTTAIDFRTLPACIPSLCIPRVYANISEARIRKIFDELKIGIIERIDIVSKTTEKGERFNRVFIHMERWFRDGNAEIARERLLNGKDIKIIYDDPWFWKVSAFRPEAGSNNNNNNNNNNVKKATIQFDSSDEEERRKPKSTDIKPLIVPRSTYNGGGCKKVKKEDTYARSSPPRQRQVPLIPRSVINRSVIPRSPSSSPPRARPCQVEHIEIKVEKVEKVARVVKDMGPPAVQYDPAVFTSTKKRVIKIRKDPVVKQDLVIEEEAK